MSKFTPTPQELALVNTIFTQADAQKIGVVTGDAAVKIFSGSKLPPSVLAEVWNLADEDNNGVLTRKGVGIAVRLLGHAQRGERLSEALVSKPGPIPTIEGLPPVATPSSSGVPPARSPPPGFPPITPQDKAKFLKLFLGCHPVNGLLSGEKARDVFVKSKLSVDKLSQIWNLADTKNRGSLDATDFTIAMYLIQASMSGQLKSLPASLPHFIYDQATNGVVPQATGGSGHISPSLTGGFPGGSVQPQYTGQALSSIRPQMTGQTYSSIQPQMTGQMMSTPTAPPLPARSAAPSTSSSAFPFLQQQSTGATPQWDVTPQEKVNADRIFDTLDTSKRGYIEGDVAVPFMLQSKLPEDVLAQVWDLSDLNNDGRLTRDGFAVAMHLIQGKLAGKDVPSSLPVSLVPPAMRGSGSALAAPSQPAVPEAIRDLLWDDSPPASATAPTHSQSFMQPQATGSFMQPQATGSYSQAQATRSLSPHPAPTMSPPPAAPVSDPFAGGPFGGYSAPAPPAPHKDLLGDDDEPHASSPPLHDQSAEIGNVKNQLSSTNRSLDTAKNEREQLERLLTEQAAQLASLQTQLSSAKASYDTETRLLSTLKDRFAGQSAEIQKTREELIRAESDLSATKVEKAEVEGALLRDKEEVRDLQRKMSEVGTLIEATKAEVEKLKKDAKQQKGLLAIAKKQLATREAEKAKYEKELEDARAELQETTKERQDAEAQLSTVEEPRALFTNGHVSPPPPAVSPDSSLVFAAGQPLPMSPEVSPPASIMGKSTNPFDRLARSASPRPESPFLPFAASSVLPTPTAAPTAAAEEDSAEDPFGFKAFTPEPEVQAAEPETPKPSASPAPLVIGSPHSQEVVSPADTDLFTTPPTTATSHEHVIAPQPEDPTVSHFPAIDDNATDESAPTPTAPATATPLSPQLDGEDTDLMHQLKELEPEESDTDSSSDDEDNEPLTSVKAKLTGDHANGAATSGSAFDDSFGISSTPQPQQTSVPAEDAFSSPGPAESTPVQASGAVTDFASMFETPAVSREPPPSAPIPAVAENAKPNGNAFSSAGVSEFDHALGKLPSLDSSATSSQFTNLAFDSAFEDNFDFAAATAAQPAVSNGTISETAGAAAFPPPPSGSHSTAPRQSSTFDDVFGTSASAAPSSAPAPAPAPVQPIFPTPAPSHSALAGKGISFDDAFGASNGTASAAPNLNASTSSSRSNGGFSFDDAFGGEEPSLALDTSFTSQTPSYQPPPGPPPNKAGPTPFPTSSVASSPRGSSSTQPGRRSESPSAPRVSSPTPRHASPPPRHASPKPRPSTGDSTKEKAAATRHNRLSIRLPFGRKKKNHDAPPVPSLAQQQIVEDPTPAVEDDVEAVKTLCGMGFSRTQAVTALEEHSYDVQRALNSLLGQ
ncbi:uncharacterized protein TRAVEDRAFT_146188 [Trametes versicolor FP-101664 SS1]|uniref:uncharacterized protein n=1 Tax=Trametes versicolor (strain FP-101664) TaxID=717944 RepID=UPI0004624437|nr:uncharacterized protein TRAVEDRAFT_146188 [Trametes versicolor FP-101664 SS1]EIW60637.1 hypothetical protein TRAVEDRAFT_146188 [Trametes versicolor FP-101664 SS1]